MTGASLSAGLQPDGYPHRFEADVVLVDGGTLHVRPIRPTDDEAVAALHRRLSSESVYLRFFSPLPELSPTLLARFTRVDYVDRLGLVAELGDDLVGVARYDRVGGSDEAEVAFVVEDAHQGRGIGTILLEHLAVIGRENGIRRFVADTLPTNRRMLSVFRAAGFEDQRDFADGLVRVTFDIEPTEGSMAAMHAREHHAAAHSIARLLAPKSIAVVGASRRAGTVGHVLLTNLLGGGFTGPVYPVNPEARSVAGVRAYPRILDVPDQVDLAVVVVPASAVPEVVAQCGAKGVGGLAVVSAGFAETGAEGVAAERALVASAHRNGMRVIGPNCMGVANTAADVSMNATLAPLALVGGRASLMAQGGALGIAILEEAKRRGIGIATFVSAGNKADVSGNDLLHYWEGDPGTEVVLLYLESFGNPRTFARVARTVSRRKPIVAVKSGRTTGGPVEATTRLGPAALGDDAVDALFTHTGVIRVDTFDQLFDVAQALVSQPLPAGHRVAVVGNSGGPTLLAVDACENAGLSVPELSAGTREELRRLLGATAPVRNPVELGALSPAGNYERVLSAVLADPAVDAALTLFLPSIVPQQGSPAPEAEGRSAAAAVAGSAEAVAAAVSRAAEQSGVDAPKPVLANFLALTGMPEALHGERSRVPSYTFPESAALTLARMADYAAWLRRPEGRAVVAVGIDRDGARAAVQEALAVHPGGGSLEREATARLLASYGIELSGHPGDLGTEARVETVVSVVVHPTLGPFVTLGMAGAAAQSGARRVSRILPITNEEAAEFVTSAPGASALMGDGNRGRFDVAALEELLVLLGIMADDLPEVAALDLEPVLVARRGVVVAGATARVVPYEPHPEMALRRLR